MSDNLFKLQINFTKSYVGEDGGHYLEGVASGPEVDLTDERMSPDALKSMVASIKKRLIEFRDAHKQEWNDDLGEVVDLSLDDSNHLIYRSKLDMNLSGSQDLWYRVHTLGKKYGVSIGGAVLKAGMEYVADLGRQVYTYFDVDLYEISITRQAAYQYSFANAVLKSLPKGHPMADTTKAEVEKTDATDAETQTEETTQDETHEETVAAEEQSDATQTDGQEVETEQAEDAAEQSDADAEATQGETEADGDVEKTAESDATTDEVAKSAILGSWAEADVVYTSIDSLAWNLKWFIWDVMLEEDKTADEKNTAVASALAEFSRIVQSVATSLIENAPSEETRKAIEATRENAPEAVSKSLTDNQTQVAELTKSLEAKTKEVETAQTELAETKKSLAEKETELEKIEKRKAVVFDKFDGVAVAAKDAAQKSQSPTLSRWMNS